MNIQPIKLNLNNNYENTSQKNISFKSVIPHGFPKNPTKETISLFSSPDFHKLIRALSDIGKDLHVYYEPKNLGLHGPCGCSPIPEMYNLYYSAKGSEQLKHLTKLAANEKRFYQEINVPELLKKITDKFVPLQDVKIKGIVEYISDGINADLKK